MKERVVFTEHLILERPVVETPTLTLLYANTLDPLGLSLRPSGHFTMRPVRSTLILVIQKVLIRVALTTVC